MSEYTKDFYEPYLKQLAEPLVRSTHDRMFELFHNFYDNNYGGYVIDLGCGTGEFHSHDLYHYDYAGFDTAQSDFIEPSVFHNKNFVKDLDEILEFKFDKGLTSADTFVSLFATEIHLPVQEKYNLYRKIFRDVPHIQAGLVAGFYYEDKMNEECIIENVKDVSQFTVYQTIENQREWMCDEFEEYRIYTKVPSKMFGQNLTEVWKFFRRSR